MTRTTKNITKDPFVGQPKLFSDQFLPSNNFFFIHFRAINIGSQQRADTGEYKKTNRDSLKETAEKVGAKDLFPTYPKKGIIKKIEKICDTNIRLHNYNYYVGVRYRKREQEVQKENNKLFGISKKDWKQEIIKDRNHKNTSDIDIENLERCQRGEQVGTFGGHN